jgi:galactokinase
MNIETVRQNIRIGEMDNMFKMLTVIDQKGFSRKRWIALIDDFEKNFSETEIFGFTAPGRSEIGGNHTDHQWGRVLAAAVNLDTIAVVSKNNSSMIHIVSKGYSIKPVNIQMLHPHPVEQRSSEALIRGVCAGFSNKGFEIGGFNAVIDSQVLSGSGISSSAAFEVLIGQILSDLFNDGSVEASTIASIGQFAENEYFNKPCGLMDQMASAIGGFVFIDFCNPQLPKVEKIDFDLNASGYSLCLTNTGGSHENLSDAYGLMPLEMKKVAEYFDQPVLSRITMHQFLDHLPKLREKCGDRACLRAFHFLNENVRVVDQKNALLDNDIQKFMRLTIESGQSSFMYLQNVYMPSEIEYQPLSLALAISQQVLKSGAYRVHGGGLAGTIQAFVSHGQLSEYTESMEHVFGKGSTYTLAIRSVGSLQVF